MHPACVYREIPSSWCGCMPVPTLNGEQGNTHSSPRTDRGRPTRPTRRDPRQLGLGLSGLVGTLDRAQHPDSGMRGDEIGRRGVHNLIISGSPARFGRVRAVAQPCHRQSIDASWLYRQLIDDLVNITPIIRPTKPVTRTGLTGWLGILAQCVVSPRLTAVPIATQCARVTR
jgi:hypothetical protein